MALTDLRDQLAADASGDDDDDGIDIEVIDDRPEGDQRDPVDTTTVDDDDDALTDDEIEALGGRAAKRIKKLTFKYNEERRQREQIERERTEAVAHARRMQEQNQGQASDITKYQKALIDRQGVISESHIVTTKQNLSAAMESGDPDKIADAQQALTQATIRQESVTRTKQQWEGEQGQSSRQPRGQTQGQPLTREQQAAAAVSDIAARQPTPEAKAWTNKNTWFGPNRRMTSFAYGVHEELVDKGVPTDTPAYYEAIDQAMRKTFPTAFAGSGGAADDSQGGGDDTVVDINSASSSRQTPVAPTGRTSGTDRANRGKVRLTRTQVQTAKALGVPLKEYAKQVLKEAQNG